MQYKSKQQHIQRSAEQIYTLLSNFNHFTPILQDKVEFWEATQESCKFRVQGFDVQLRFEEREPHRHIKLVPEGDSLPFPFAFWVQLKEAAPYDTRLRVVLDVELNMMMRMMVGGKLQSATDKIAEQIAMALR